MADNAKKLEIQLWRHFNVIGSVTGCLNLCEDSEIAALIAASLVQLHGELINGYESEDVFRCFFRIAETLLAPTGMSVHNWHVCDTCRACVSSSYAGSPQSMVGRPCPEPFGDTCTGTMRELRWADLNRPDLDA